MRVYVVGHAPAGEDAATGGFDWFFTPEQAINNARRALREIGGLGSHSITYVPIDVPDDVAHPDGQTPVDNDSITRWIDARLELVEVGLIPRADQGEPADAPPPPPPAPAAAQTRPSAIVRRPDPETPISEATVAELLTEALERARARRGDRRGGASGREFSIVVTLLEDAITRHNKGVYMERGVFAITDAERIPGTGAVVEPLAEPLPLAVIAFSRAEATSYILHASHEEPIEIVTRREDALGKRFRDAVYVTGWDRDLSSSASDAIRGAVSVSIRPTDG